LIFFFDSRFKRNLVLPSVRSKELIHYEQLKTNIKKSVILIPCASGEPEAGRINKDLGVHVQDD